MIAAIYIAVAILFVVGALLTLYRIVRGPSILDRMIASDVLLTTLILAVGADMVINNHSRSVPIMLVLSAIAIFATVAVARYVSKQDRAITGAVPPDDHQAAKGGS
ncbi:monovalent cation/H+ antiporter complex subunit F [Salinibacterium sp. G-O1]|uniref:monovalent cation/H+ antiporter complex subunit F n=1 Tax=Salinibacterium sp. G-O1 TaxID=3046208 RepID=UPI0024BBE5D4|nr:monovalent cation/H+ antiporter complex subunit F [Salinibacterium sp. G-O1]MDJ0335863.1 monovalent cation/H+ antiporter complex subunit F [Salinibacterium sp. G-O1]